MSIAKTTRPHLLTREAAAARIEALEAALRMPSDVWSRHNLFNLMTAVSKANPKATEEELFLKISDAMVTHIRPSDIARAALKERDK